jgi:hypothetical protein
VLGAFNRLAHAGTRQKTLVVIGRVLADFIVQHDLESSFYEFGCVELYDIARLCYVLRRNIFLAPVSLFEIVRLDEDPRLLCRNEVVRCLNKNGRGLGLLFQPSIASDPFASEGIDRNCLTTACTFASGISKRIFGLAAFRTIDMLAVVNEERDLK